MLQILEQDVISRDPSRSAFMPVITPLSSGQWLACQHVGTALASPDNDIEVLDSSDQGHSWNSHGTFRTETDVGFAYRGPEIAELPDGRLLMTACRFHNEGKNLFDFETEALERPDLLLYWSEDKGQTWSDAQLLTIDALPPEKYTANGAGRFLQLAENRWLYFIETWKPTGYDGPPDQKAAFVVSEDQGRTWGDLTVVADDTSGRLLYWDMMECVLPDGRIYAMFWTHLHGTKNDLNNHWSVSEDGGWTWSEPRPTNLRGQVCSPIALPDGRVAAIYNHRHDPHGIHVAVSEDLETFDLDNQVVVFDAGAEAQLGDTKTDAFFEEHLLIGFGKPCGHFEPDTGTLLTYFWCTSGGITHTRWVRLGTL